MPKSLSEIASELNIPIGHNSLRQTVKLGDAIAKDLGYSRGIKGAKQGKKWAILEKQSTTIRTESCFLKVFGSPSTKSILTICHGQFGTGNGVYNPVFCFCCFASW